MGTINLVNSLRYDMHGRKRKTKALNKARSSSQVRTHGFHPCNSGSNPLRATKQVPTQKEWDDFRERLSKTEYTPAPDNSWKLEISKQYTVAPAYNKGAYQVIPKSDVKHIGK